ncbi:hypothetical protein PV10_06352 [Exophiala mesophila]|uniref:Major facilitator superfamily (MFS) profile domain-containing protein n=1 Tax=Exophiala mesophila TaxID=212818 RepID=A0A0D1XUH6_EXOME|nr:uncharacterized protein PV10_06352 [Exophiala mesophila]KIV91861.1 hypothetical protein PV10_06352 [Exophiala mesophila]
MPANADRKHSDKDGADGELVSPQTSQISHLEEKGQNIPVVDNTDQDDEFSYTEQRKIVHRIDRRLIIVLGLMYCVSLIDRGNMPNAAIAGMHDDLGTNIGYRYSIATLVFFATYTLFQPPATVVTRKLGPRNFLPALCVAWGVVMIGFGFIQDWVVLIPLRLLLGLFEAGFFPGCFYLISTYYTRFDMQKRYACFYLVGTLCNGLSGVLAYGLQQMDGLANYRGWRWIFIIEGILTVIAGCIGYIYVVDFPDQIAKKPAWGFLSVKEAEFLLRRINRDRNDADPEPFSLKVYVAGGKDWKVWSFALVFFCLTTSAYAISFFLPIILRENMGFNISEAQYLSAPPYGLACIVMYTMAWVGDRYRIRGPLLFVNCLFGLIGAPLLGWATQPGVRYFGTFLICASAQGGIPTCMAYQATNVRGHWKRAFSSATLIGAGGVGGVAGSLIFRSVDRPHYRPGVYGCIACNVLVVILVVVNSIYFRHENKKADRGEKILEGDPNFRYTI